MAQQHTGSNGGAEAAAAAGVSQLSLAPQPPPPPSPPPTAPLTPAATLAVLQRLLDAHAARARHYARLAVGFRALQVKVVVVAVTTSYTQTQRWTLNVCQTIC